jgi:hypothetical protein
MTPLEIAVDNIVQDKNDLWDKYGDFLMDSGHPIGNGNMLVELMESQTDIEIFAQDVIDHKLI